MILRVTAFKSSDGKTFESLEEVQKHEIEIILNSAPITNEAIDESRHAQIVANVCAAILNHKEKILDILTTGPRSKPKARSINGGTRKRTPRIVTPEKPAA